MVIGYHVIVSLRAPSVLINISFFCQNLTNCDCKAFIGSVASMKGNEVRIVFFLQPVDQFKDGEVAKVESPLRNYFGRIWGSYGFWISSGLCALFLISLVLALALTLKEGPPQPVVTTTTAPPTTTTATTTTSTPTPANTTTLPPLPTPTQGDM